MFGPGTQVTSLATPSSPAKNVQAIAGALVLLLLGACTGSQSALAPAGRQAARVAELFWGMVVGGAVIWLVVVGLAVHATYFAREPISARSGRLLIIGGGVVFPIVLLTGLLTYSLSMLPDMLAPAPEGSLRIEVTGHQWWWRVRYPREQTGPVDLANEIHLPVGKPVEFQLESSDVIHSFWIPALGGKVDMIPGRRTRLVLQPTQTGVYRGVCAEYCGASHALMSLFVVVEPEDEFQRWLAKQAQPAPAPRVRTAAQGEELLIASGCGACHSVRGTPADGVLGPDLTHVGSRQSIGAGALPLDSGALLRWISRTNDIKPSVHMPAFGMLPPDDLQALAVYLEGLK
jgi:cytochrome c oxidase subunit 2